MLRIAVNAPLEIAVNENIYNIMDPWQECGNTRKTGNQPGLTLKFEDNFEPGDRLPDSLEYLASLEKKLARLKERQSKKDLVQSLEETRKSCMLRLVSEDSSPQVSQQDLKLDEVITNHALLRHIAPERQALTLGELVELLKADQLAEVLAEDNENTPDIKDC